MTVVRIYTAAPDDYDWGWTTDKGPTGYVDRDGNAVRAVDVADEYHAEMQFGRYLSGLCLTMTPERFEEEKTTKYPAMFEVVDFDDLMGAVRHHEGLEEPYILSWRGAAHGFKEPDEVVPFAKDKLKLRVRDGEVFL